MLPERASLVEITLDDHLKLQHHYPFPKNSHTLLFIDKDLKQAVSFYSGPLVAKVFNNMHNCMVTC